MFPGCRRMTAGSGPGMMLRDGRPLIFDTCVTSWQSALCLRHRKSLPFGARKLVFQAAKAYLLHARSLPLADFNFWHRLLLMNIYNPQIQIFAKSETKRHFFECSFKTKRSKKDLHTTQTIKPEIRAKKLYSGLCQKLFNRQYNCIQTMFKQHCYKCFHPAFYITLYLYIWQHNSCVR